jgi:hypothetical protein
MELRMLYKSHSSGGSGCPSIYVADSGEFVIQGLVIDDETRRNLQDVLPGEDAVRISADVVIGALAKYQAECGLASRA